MRASAAMKCDHVQRKDGAVGRCSMVTPNQAPLIQVGGIASAAARAALSGALADLPDLAAKRIVCGATQSALLHLLACCDRASPYQQ